MDIIGYHIEDNCIASSNEVLLNPTPGQCINFLLAGKGIKLFWNLDYAAAKLIKLLGWPVMAGRKLWDSKRVYDNQLDHTIGYIPGKSLSIRLGKGYGKRFVNFSDAEQYHKEARGESTGDNIEEYCKGKAIRAKQIGQEVYNALREVGCDPVYLTSPIKVWEKDMLSGANLPTVTDIPEEAAYYAYQCAHGVWVEAFARGYFPCAYDYDLPNAYGEELRELLDIRQGEWHKSNVFEPMALYGFLRGKLNVMKEYNPFLWETRLAEGVELTTPLGEREDFITLESYNFLREHDLGFFQIYDAWWWEKNLTLPDIYLYNDMVAQLERAKVKANGIAKETYKRTINGIWGKMLEVHGEDEFGDLFNPVYGSITETNVRLKDCKGILKALELGIRPLGVIVDGLLLEQRCQALESNPGGFRLTHKGDCLIVSSGVIGMSERVANDWDFSLNYDKLKGILESNPSASQYAMTRPSFVSLGKALQEGRWLELGNRETIARTLNVTFEAKRYYPEAPGCGADILSGQYWSEPWDIELLEGGIL
jgi:hypothetical protein